MQIHIFDNITKETTVYPCTEPNLKQCEFLDKQLYTITLQNTNDSLWIRNKNERIHHGRRR